MGFRRISARGQFRMILESGAGPPPHSPGFAEAGLVWPCGSRHCIVKVRVAFRRLALYGDSLPGFAMGGIVETKLVWPCEACESCNDVCPDPDGRPCMIQVRSVFQLGG